MFASAGTQIDYVVGSSHHCLVVLHDQHGVTNIPQTLQRRDQSIAVMGMQSDRWFVTYVEHSHQTGTDLCSESNPLSFATG